MLSIGGYNPLFEADVRGCKYDVRY